MASSSSDGSSARIDTSSSVEVTAVMETEATLSSGGPPYPPPSSFETTRFLANYLEKKWNDLSVNINSKNSHNIDNLSLSAISPHLSPV